MRNVHPPEEIQISPVTIRPFETSDAEAFATAVRESIADLGPWMPWSRAEYSAADSLEWFAQCKQAATQHSAFEFAIVSRENLFLGGAGINRIDSENKRANLGYWVRTGAHRAGVATAACKLVADWAFQHTDLTRLEIVVAAGNSASHKVAAKAGALFEGSARSRLVLHGVAHDAAIYSIIRSDRVGGSAGGHFA